MSKEITLRILKGLEMYHRDTMASEYGEDSEEYQDAREDLENTRKAIEWVENQK